MRVRTLAPVSFFLATALLGAEVIPQPGQLAPAAAAPLSGTASLVQSPKPGSNIVAVSERHDAKMKAVWMVSLASMLAGSGADAATSWGKREGNGFLAASNGTFGGKALSLKAGLAAATFVPQVMLRNHKNLRTKFIVANFAEAGAFTGAAIHNSGVKAPN